MQKETIMNQNLQIEKKFLTQNSANRNTDVDSKPSNQIFEILPLIAVNFEHLNLILKDESEIKLINETNR